MMLSVKIKSHERAPTNSDPLGYHGVGNNLISLKKWEQIKFSSMWIRRTIAGIVELVLE